MTHPAFPAALLLLLAAAPAAPGREPGVVGQLLFHQHIVIRVPRLPASRPMSMPSPPPAATWRESKGPQCIAGDDLMAASIPTDDRVDLMMRGGERLRARLDKRCRTIDYYTGFYVTAGHDGQVCARRDAIRTRSGDECGIDKFRRLTPAD